MINLLQAIDFVYQHLHGGLLSTSITGKIYKNERPDNSNLEDVVINSLGLNANKLQQGIMNVNIHVPKRTETVGAIAQTFPNHTRLLALTTIALDELNEVWSGPGGWNFEVEQHNLIKDQDETYMNIRLEFSAINNSIKH